MRWAASDLRQCTGLFKKKETESDYRASQKGPESWPYCAIVKAQCRIGIWRLIQERP